MMCLEVITLVLVAATAVYTGWQAQTAARETQLLYTQVAASLVTAEITAAARVRTYPDDLIEQLKAEITAQFLQLVHRPAGPQDPGSLLPISRDLPLNPSTVVVRVENVGSGTATSLLASVGWAGEISEYSVEAFGPEPSLVTGGARFPNISVGVGKLYEDGVAIVYVAYLPMEPLDQTQLVAPPAPEVEGFFPKLATPTAVEGSFPEFAAVTEVEATLPQYAAAKEVPFFPQFRLYTPPGKRTYREIIVQAASDQTPYMQVGVLPEDTLATIGLERMPIEEWFPSIIP